MKESVIYGIIQKEDNRYKANCLELDIAIEGNSLEEARNNLKAAVDGYLESVQKKNKEINFNPIPVPEKLAEKYYWKFKELYRSEFYELRKIAQA